MSEETAPIGGEHSSALQVLSANLKSSRTDTIIDIRSVLLEITFYESLARPTSQDILLSLIVRGYSKTLMYRVEKK